MCRRRRLSANTHGVRYGKRPPVPPAELCVGVIHQNVFYFEGRQRRRIYQDVELHALILTLILTLLLSPGRGLLDPSYSDQYPTHRHRRNIPFLLSAHLNHSANRVGIVLGHHLEQIASETSAAKELQQDFASGVQPLALARCRNPGEGEGHRGKSAAGAMYGLRSINNMYSEHAGQRSDFIIVGHPEFQQGKVRSTTRTFPAWDMRPLPSKPGNNLAKSRSIPALVRQLSDPGPVGNLKERALRKSGSRLEVLPVSPRESVASSFRAFEQAVVSMGKHEEAAKFCREQRMRTAASFACAKGHSATCRNFATLHREVNDIRERLEDPSARERIMASDAWKYYAQHLEQAKQLEARLRRQRKNMEPNVQALHDSATAKSKCFKARYPAFEDRSVLPWVFQQVDRIGRIGELRLLKLLVESAMHRWMHASLVWHAWQGRREVVVACRILQDSSFFQELEGRVPDDADVLRLLAQTDRLVLPNQILHFWYGVGVFEWEAVTGRIVAQLLASYAAEQLEVEEASDAPSDQILMQVIEPSRAGSDALCHRAAVAERSGRLGWRASTGLRATASFVRL
ncbi:hypothetical protein AK812_SmicGene15084 [Symbiodinium microadriaticum]|uniref:Uncharacterized protein n=1 Tax=Symbiodinium microadriaticum TaxID=2951 RepID=A0A1Q9E419_SYMMI|nr:hypothetical protein AK812_SmicGene15084 [Symbiodinium microadriaticum]